MNNSNDIENEIRRQIDFLDEAAAKARSGEVADVSAMDGEVAILCEKIARMPAEEAHRLEPAMEEMIGKLEGLAVELHALRERIDGDED